jgi:predicted glycosyltransferase
MRILIDIGHPAHVHLFKNIVLDMQKRGHCFFFTVRTGENEKVLLDELGFQYEVIGRKRRGVVLKIAGLVVFTLRIIRISHRFKPDLFLSHGSMYAGYASRFCRKPHIALEDTGNMEQLMFSIRVSDVILTPDSIIRNLGSKQIKYPGYHELAYLSPKYFKPDRNVFNLLGVKPGEKYAILRFGSWGASHDIGQKGIEMEEKIRLVNYLVSEMKVFISSEGSLPGTLEQYRIHIPFAQIHNAMAFAYVYIGEGATMATEAAVLGVPSVYISSIETYNHTDLINYGILTCIKPSEKSLMEIIDFIKGISMVDIKKRRDAMLSRKTDVVSFLTWFVERWPESYRMTKANPDISSGISETISSCL